MIDDDSPPLGIDIGSNHSLAVNSKGQLYAWGVNTHGQCGIDTKGTEGNHSVVEGLADAKIKQVACGDVHSLALDYDGNLYIWGSNKQGQLGNGNYRNIKKPYKLSNNIPSGDIKEISAKGNISEIGRAHV